MSVQKLKKGFTLIELMVVIVIIGILAAIAIPKLFGMSAKAKAQEVGPAMGTWAKMQQAYKMETGSWGGPKKISYKLPGDVPDGGTDGKSKTSNFFYTISPTGETDKSDNATLSANNRFSADDCEAAKDDGTGGATWKGDFTDVNDEDPTTTIEGDTNGGCKALTPNFEAIGKKPTTPATPGGG